MRCFRNSFKRVALLATCCILLDVFRTGAEEGVPHPEALALIVEDLRQVIRHSQPERDLENYCRRRYKGNGRLIPMFTGRREAVVLWTDGEQRRVVFYSFRLSDQSEAVQLEGVWGSGGYLYPAAFDRWLLGEPEVLEKLLQDATFLNHYLPGLPGNNLSAPRLHPYLFRVMVPEKHYNLAAIIGEDRFFSDITEDDFELSFMNTPILHYTRLPNGETVYFSKIKEPLALSSLPGLLDRYLADATLRDLFKATFQRMEKTIRASSLDTLTLLGDMKAVLESISQNYDFSNIPPEHLAKLQDHLLYFLNANGLSSPAALLEAPEWLKIAIGERFFTAKTTAFFRDWRDMEYLRSWLEERDALCRAENRPLTIKVFGCSTGQEPLSYAIMLLDLGYSNFRIFATDIDQNAIAEARSMRYHRDKFQTLPSTLQTHLLENYFQAAGDDHLEIRFRNFMEERILYGIQDITLPLTPPSKSDFTGPYDLISVKNVLLYLDHQAVLETVPRLERMTTEGGILVLRDKRYRAERFLEESLTTSVGLTPYMALKMPASSDRKAHERVFALFSNPAPPRRVLYFYDFARKFRITDLADELLQTIHNTAADDLAAQRILYLRAIQDLDMTAAAENLRAIAHLDPIAFSPLYVTFQKTFPEHSLSKDRDLLQLLILYQNLGMEGMDERKMKLLEDTIRSFANPEKTPLESLLVLTHMLTALDQGRFPKIESSPDGRWILEAARLLLERLNEGEARLLRDHRARILDHYLSLYSSKLESQDAARLIQKHWDLFREEPFSVYSPDARIAIIKFAVFYSQNAAFDLREKLQIVNRIVNGCQISRDDLRKLPDREYTEYFMVLASAYEFLAMKNETLLGPEKKFLLLYAFEAVENVLEVRSVYASRAVDFKEQILKHIAAIDGK